MNKEECIAKLKQCTIKTQKLTYRGLTVFAKCVKVHDGNKITCSFILPGSDSPCNFVCKCYGYKSSKINSKDSTQKEKAKTARNYLSELILDKIVILKLGDFDPYGHVLVKIYFGGKNINKDMIEKGHGTPYDDIKSK